MRISIVGSGYVGLVSGAGLSDVGHHVVCMDIDEARVEGLKNGIVPIYEPGLDQMLNRNFSQGRLEFTTSIKDAVEHAEVLFIAVGNAYTGTQETVRLVASKHPQKERIAVLDSVAASYMFY